MSQPTGTAVTRYVTARAVSRPGTRLFCFPSAGGGASVFTRWQRGLPDTLAVVPVQLPGREWRLAEPRHTELDDLITELDSELDDLLGEPHLFYGHSMGALIAYTLTQRRAARGARLPEVLLLGAHRAPDLPAPDVLRPSDSDADLLADLLDVGGIPADLPARPEWLQLLLPIARDDLLLCRSAEQASYPPLPVPMHAFAGADDTLVRVEEVAQWCRHSTVGFRLSVVAGSHFFIREDEASFLRNLDEVIAQYAPLAAVGAR